MRTLRWAPALVLAAGLVGGAAGQPADGYEVSAQLGPWMICVASFTGPESPAEARRLADHLRERDKLPAYVFNWADDARQKEKEEYERRLAELRKEHPGATIPFKHTRHNDYCAVLVGGYPDLDAANAALARIKKLPPPEVPAGDVEFAIRPDPDGKGATKMMVNPFFKSFAIRNPALPPAPKDRPKFDPLWKDLNASEEYSLLKNPKPYTLLVKEYCGNSQLFNQREDTSSFWEKLTRMGRKGDALSAAGKQAHELARFLRDPRLGYEAYVLHTRTSSVVTVGAFDGPDDKELKRVQQQLAALKFKAGAAAATPGADPIGLMPSPVTIEVPRP
jgi:hypothetical protein